MYRYSEPAEINNKNPEHVTECTFKNVLTILGDHIVVIWIYVYNVSVCVYRRNVCSRLGPIKIPIIPRILF